MKVFLGCSQNIRPGWLNVDLYPRSETVIKDDARTLATFRDGSITELESLHLIEHISHRDVPKMLRHWRRAMAPGGKLSVECPDILAIAREYVAWHEAGWTWTDSAANRFVKKPASALSHRSWHTLFGGTHEHPGQMNGSWWDAPRLVMELKEAKFVSVRAEAPVHSNPQWGPSIRVVAEAPK